ncbi:MAG: M48 family metallopeptidase [Acidobacteria bacterium]|jgi:hypothetical protein|nr:M48 family metallopeptidase [Acidobacteriota bacterium]
MSLFGKLLIKKVEEPVIMKFEGIPFIVIRRQVKYSRVEYRNSGLRVIVPRGIDPLKVLEDNKKSILKKYQRLISQVETARDKTLIKWTDGQFAMIIDSYVKQYSRLLKVKAKEIKFRKMKRRWGSCRSDGVITLNRYLQYVPEILIAYIVFHELAHLVVRGHNHRFKRIIALEFPNYRALDKELNLYGLKLLT